MPRCLHCSCFTLFICCLSGFVPDARGVTPAERYLDAQLRVAAGLQERLPAMTAVAEESARRLLSGGQLYLAGEPGMVAELLGRAGGLCAARKFPPDKTALAANDVVIFSDYGLPHAGGQDNGWARLLVSPALVVAFAAAENPILRASSATQVRPMPVAIPVDSRLLTMPDGRRVLPTASPAIAMAQWTYVAELIAACRRQQQKQLAVYLSIFLDDGRRRFERTKNLTFDPQARPEPIAAGQLGRRYLDQARDGLEKIRGELEPIQKAALWIRQAMPGRPLARSVTGHLPPVEVNLPGDVPFFTVTVRVRGEQASSWIKQNLRYGDVYLYVGYQQNEDDVSAAANAMGVRTIFITSQAPRSDQSLNTRNVYIDPHWPMTDACLDLPGYDVRACPLSCVLGMSVYWAICGEVIGQL